MSQQPPSDCGQLISGAFKSLNPRRLAEAFLFPFSFFECLGGVQKQAASTGWLHRLS